MGISSEIHVFLKEKNETLEISSLETEDTKDSKSFTIDYLFNHVISEINIKVNLDISKISVLELPSCNLTDIPLACKKLNLKQLNLSNNQLEHVPLCLYNGMKQLELLDLSHNNIASNFDMEPDCLPYLKVMKLNKNKFQNIPKWFLTFRCTNLEKFNYSDNKARSYKFMKNSFNINLIKLKKLELANSCLIDQDFNLLKCFRQLEYLDISSSHSPELSPHINRFDDLDQLFVKPKWKELCILKLNGLFLSIFPEGIAWIETLRELHICNNCLSWLPDDIRYLVNLEVLNVSNNYLIGLPKHLERLEQLEVVQASKNCIEVVPDFSLMPNLKTLDLFDNLLSTISFNVHTIDFIDLEYNHCDTTEFEQFSLYEEKKTSLRQKYSIRGRYDGPKISSSKEFLESDSESTDSYDESLLAVKNVGIIECDQEENWDLPVKVIKINSDIDTEDDEWQGEEYKPSVKRVDEMKRIYISDDDWMFVDDDES